MPFLDLPWLGSTDRRPRSGSIATNSVTSNEEYSTSPTSVTSVTSPTLISPPTPTTTTTTTTARANTYDSKTANASATISAQTILNRSASTDSVRKLRNAFRLRIGSFSLGTHIFTSEPEEQQKHEPESIDHQRHDSKFEDDEPTNTIQLQSAEGEEQVNETKQCGETDQDKAVQVNKTEQNHAVEQDKGTVQDNEAQQDSEVEQNDEAERDNEVEQDNEAEWDDNKVEQDNEADQDKEIGAQDNEAAQDNKAEQDSEVEQDNDTKHDGEIEQNKEIAQASGAPLPDCEPDNDNGAAALPDCEPDDEATTQPDMAPSSSILIPPNEEGESTQPPQPDGHVEPQIVSELTPPYNELTQLNQSHATDRIDSDAMGETQSDSETTTQLMQSQSLHDAASQTDSELSKVSLSQPAQPDTKSHSERKQFHSELEHLYRRVTSQLDCQNNHQHQRMPRVKVQWQDTRLVIPVPVPKGSKHPLTVAQLLEEIDARFRKHAKGLDDDNYFVELRTIDGFLLDKTDRAADVIGDGDMLSAIDYSNWFKSFKAENNLIEWLSVKRIDYVDNNHKWVRVGRTTRANRIYFDFGTGIYGAEESKRFRLIDEEEIESLPKPSRKFVEGVKGGQDPDRWYADTHIVTDEKGTRYVEIAIKSMSDPRPQIETLCFAKNAEGRYQMKSKKVNQAVFVPFVPKSYTVPTITTVGPTLKEEDYPTPIDPSKEAVQSAGESPFVLQQTGYPLAEQQWDYSGAWQLVTCEFRVTNTASQTLSVVGISAEVQDKKGEWRSALAYSGAKESKIYYNIRNEHDAILRYDAHSVSKLSLRVKYGLDYANYKSYSGRARRLHPSFPNPCNIRFTLRDQNNAKTSIMMQVFGTGGFMTRSAYEENLHVKLYHWVQCDDTSSEERMYVPIEYKQGWAGHSVLEINLLVASRKHQIEAEVLRRWTWLANREDATELEIKDWNWEGSDGAFGIKFHALFDRDEKQVYGMKITLHTTTSKVVDSFLFPKDLIMS